MKKIIAFLAAITLSVCAASVFTSCNDGTLKIGYTNYAPMNYYDDDNNFVGFDTELALAVCEILGYKAEFVEINWDNKVMSLNAKEIDAVWNGMTITDELSAAMAITEPYLENKQVVVCRKEKAAEYSTVSDLAKAGEILVEAGSAGYNVVTEAGYTPTTMDLQNATLLEVKTSENKISVIDSTMAKVLTGAGTSYTDLTFVDVGFEAEQFGIGFRKGDTELRDKVQNAINQLKENGKYDELVRKYFS